LPCVMSGFSIPTTTNASPPSFVTRAVRRCRHPLRAPSVELRLTPSDSAVAQPNRSRKLVLGNQAIDRRAAQSGHVNHGGHSQERRGQIARCRGMRALARRSLHVALRCVLCNNSRPPPGAFAC
jgi:hypothetical protein